MDPSDLANVIGQFSAFVVWPATIAVALSSVRRLTKRIIDQKTRVLKLQEQIAQARDEAAGAYEMEQAVRILSSKDPSTVNHTSEGVSEPTRRVLFDALNARAASLNAGEVEDLDRGNK